MNITKNCFGKIDSSFKGQTKIALTTKVMNF